MRAVVRTELLYNAKRAAPYAVMLLFSANALLWWGWGPAISRGWAVNSDFYIVRLFAGFTFMTMPLFIALLMGDAVTRDFQLQVDPLIFSKPIRRFEYLAGKFAGNFAVLVCCQAAFALTLLALQAIEKRSMIVLPFRLLPYLQHFVFFVVISSLPLAALCFTIGALTRNVKAVYGTTVALYVAYIAWQNYLKALSPELRIVLDPLLFNLEASLRGVARVNELVVNYDAMLIWNRVAMVGVAAVIFAVLYWRFTPVWSAAAMPPLSLPRPRAAASLPHSRFDPLVAALGTELRLLRAERGLGAVIAITTLASWASVAAYPQTRIEESLLLFLFAISLFYTGEAMHRDRELRVEPLLLTTPASNAVFVVSKASAIFIVAIAMIVLHRVPLATYPILIPSAIFMIAASAALHAVFRQKHLASAIGLGIAGAFHYLVTNGVNHAAFNFVLYQLDLSGRALILHRLYTCAVATVLMFVAVRRKN